MRGHSIKGFNIGAVFSPHDSLNRYELTAPTR